mmetsp:Transcript_35358/g.59054  ORF Transcript_35358/g.59054 Transcript_35358/m.59054 type:complete len:369 (+) Transcript_35358:2428-3534(+)
MFPPVKSAEVLLALRTVEAPVKLMAERSLLKNPMLLVGRTVRRPLESKWNSLARPWTSRAASMNAEVVATKDESSAVGVTRLRALVAVKAAEASWKRKLPARAWMVLAWKSRLVRPLKLRFPAMAGLSFLMVMVSEAAETVTVLGVRMLKSLVEMKEMGPLVEEVEMRWAATNSTSSNELTERARSVVLSVRVPGFRVMTLETSSMFSLTWSKRMLSASKLKSCPEIKSKSPLEEVKEMSLDCEVNERLSAALKRMSLSESPLVRMLMALLAVKLASSWAWMVAEVEARTRTSPSDELTEKPDWVLRDTEPADCMRTWAPAEKEAELALERMVSSRELTRRALELVLTSSALKATLPRPDWKSMSPVV